MSLFFRFPDLPTPLANFRKCTLHVPNAPVGDCAMCQCVSGTLQPLENVQSGPSLLCFPRKKSSDVNWPTYLGYITCVVWMWGCGGWGGGRKKREMEWRISDLKKKQVNEFFSTSFWGVTYIKHRHFQRTLLMNSYIWVTPTQIKIQNIPHSPERGLEALSRQYLTPPPACTQR